MSDEADERIPQTLAEAASTPEGEREVAKLLEGFRNLAQRMGGTEMLREALAQSLGFLAPPEVQSQYDNGRREVIRYLESLDEPDLHDDDDDDA